MPRLEELYCDHTNLASVPSFPKLEILDCRNTKVVTLPKLPKLKDVKGDGDLMLARLKGLLPKKLNHIFDGL
jgi:hypothetical protein